MTVVEAVVEARVEAVVGVLDAAVALRVVEHELLRRGEGLAVGEAFVAVVGAVEEVAGRDLGPLTPVVAVVDPHGLHGRDALERPHHEIVAAGPRLGLPLLRGAENILEGEVLDVDVVCQGDDRKTSRLVEDVDVAAADVLVREPVSGKEPPEGTAPLVGLRHDVDGRVAVADVHARKFRLVALRIEDVDALDHVGRDVADGRHHVAAEKLAAVDEDPLHGAALRLDDAVGDLQPRHLADEGPGVGAERHLEGRGAVAQRVAPDRRAQGRDLEHDLLDRLGVGCQFERAELLVAARRADRTCEGLVSERGDAQQPFAGRDLLQAHFAVTARGGVEGIAGRVGLREQFDDGPRDRLPAGAVDKPHAERAALCVHAPHAGKKRDQQQKPTHHRPYIYSPCRFHRRPPGFASAVTGRAG